MFNELLGVSLINFISRQNIIAAIILAAIGFALSLLAPKITRHFRKGSQNISKENLCVLLRVIGLILMLLGIALVGIESIMGIVNNA